MPIIEAMTKRFVLFGRNVNEGGVEPPLLIVRKSALRKFTLDWPIKDSANSILRGKRVLRDYDNGCMKWQVIFEG